MMERENKIGEERAVNERDNEMRKQHAIMQA